jgi:hypothetical protein
MAHYMPWFQTKAAHGAWGWHWSMGKTDPEKGELASHFRPLIGAYDSRDPDVIEYQLLTMKLAGIDGVLVDWYGIDDALDYRANHEATEMVFAATKRFGMKFGVVYEDQTIGKLKTSDAVATGRATLEWVAKHWFSAPNYLRIGGQPVFMVFGPQYFKPEDWPTVLGDSRCAFFTLHHRQGLAVGAFDWPLPKDGDAGCERERVAFGERAKEWPSFISAAYPRFQDFYAQAGVHASWGTVTDQNGQTYVRTLTAALRGSAPIVQLVTWNDWGEGTQIEPSREFGYRDLAATQRLRRQWLEPRFAFKEADLALPAQLLALRKRRPGTQPALDRLALAISAGKVREANAALDRGH